VTRQHVAQCVQAGKPKKLEWKSYGSMVSFWSWSSAPLPQRKKLQMTVQLAEPAAFVMRWPRVVPQVQTEASPRVAAWAGAGWCEGRVFVATGPGVSFHQVTGVKQYFRFPTLSTCVFWKQSKHVRKKTFFGAWKIVFLQTPISSHKAIRGHSTKRFRKGKLQLSFHFPSHKTIQNPQNFTHNSHLRMWQSYPRALQILKILCAWYSWKYVARIGSEPLNFLYRAFLYNTQAVYIYIIVIYWYIIRVVCLYVYIALPVLIDYTRLFKTATTTQIAQLSIPMSSWRRKAFKNRLGLMFLIMFAIYI
jgi:hypothetical protein